MPEKLFKEIVNIYQYEDEVLKSTKDAFKLLIDIARNIEADFKKKYADTNINMSISEIGNNEFELTVGSEVLVFFLHPNIFEFSRNHEVMKTKYIQEDKRRAQCGMILIYNYLADSIKYRRAGDIGYLIGRVMINIDKHVYIEGKKEIAMLLNRYDHNQFNKETATDLLMSAIDYVIHFALLVPDFEYYKEMSIEQFMQMRDHMQIKTAKRLGFRFNADSKSSETV